MSTITLRTIEWDKCFSFGEGNIIQLDAQPLTQIIAPNGFGKSSIPLIIEESLYNKNSKGAKKSDIPNRLLDGGYNIKHTFTLNDDTYVLITERKSGIKVKLLKNGEDISSHTATNTFKLLEDLFGIDFKTFQQLVYQSTTTSLSFLTATDTQRKAFLVSLFGLDEYLKLLETFKEASKKLSLEVSTLEGKVGTINKWLASNSVASSEYKVPVEVPTIDSDMGEEILRLNTELANIKSSNNNIKKNSILKEQLSGIDIDALKSVDLVRESYDELQGEVGKLKASKASADAVLHKLKGLEDKCPTCMQDIDRTFYEDLLLENTATSNYSIGRIGLFEAEIARIKKNNSILDNTQEQIREWENINSRIDSSLPHNQLSSVDLEKELSGLKITLAEVETKIAEATRVNNEVLRYNNKLDIYKEQNEGFTNELLEAQKKLASLIDRYKNLEVLKKSFGPQGLLAYKLENLVKDLETLTNEFLSELSDGRFTIEFSICNDKLDVIITDEGKEISVLSPSSGEMARINISTLLAIRKLMSSISKNTINVLFLDEVVSVLDQEGKEKLVEVLLKEEGLNTFIVSHGWSHPLVAKLEIVKEAGVSRIEDG